MARCKRIRALSVAALAGLSLLALNPPANGVELAPQVWLVQGEVSLKQAVRIAQQTYGGEVVKAEEVVEQGQRRFHIRLLNKGRLRDVLVDAASGQILNP